MFGRESRPVTVSQWRLIGFYCAWALIRQVGHDARTIIDWFRR